MNYYELTHPYLSKLLDELNVLVSFKSHYDASTISEDAPYGNAIKECLNAFANFGEANGFNVERNPRYVELAYGDTGPIISIFGHLDVVPAIKDIYHVINDGTNLYGRGVADDKGPLLAATYSVIALKEAGLLNNVRIRIFAGGDEERGGSCVINYSKTHESPTYGFTPDCKFPLIYGESGIGSITIQKQIKLNHINFIKGGNATNTVIGECVFKVDNIDEIKNKLTVPHEINGDEIKFIGVSAHGSNPSEGKNAFLLGLLELSKINRDKEGIKIAKAFLSYNGKKLNAYRKSKLMDPTVYNVGIVIYENNQLTLKINFRHPDLDNPKELTLNIINKLGFLLLSEKYVHYLLIDPNSKFIQALFNAYQIEMNDYKNKPVTTPAGTYAKDLKNTVAFGLEPVNENYHMHEENEYIPIAQLDKAMATYAHAIINLMNLNEN